MAYLKFWKSRNPKQQQRLPATAFSFGFLVSLSLIVSACSSSGGSSEGSVNDKFPPATIDTGPPGLIVTGFDGANADATSPWFVSVDLFRLDSNIAETGDGEIFLNGYSNDFPISRHVDFFIRSLDTCNVVDLDAENTGGGGTDGGNPPQFISGGETVVINTPSGPWFTFERSGEAGDYEYSVNNELPGEILPAGATLSIPGDEFPTLAAHPLFDPEVPVRILPDPDVPVASDSDFSWIPSTTKSRVRISLLAYDETDAFVGFAGGCNVIDDGAFTMPVNVKEFIGNTRFRLEARYTRYYERIDFVNGIVVRQSNGIAE